MRQAVISYRPQPSQAFTQIGIKLPIHGWSQTSPAESHGSYGAKERPCAYKLSSQGRIATPQTS